MATLLKQIYDWYTNNERHGNNPIFIEEHPLMTLKRERWMKKHPPLYKIGQWLSIPNTIGSFPHDLYLEIKDVSIKKLMHGLKIPYWYYIIEHNNQRYYFTEKEVKGFPVLDKKP